MLKQFEVTNFKSFREKFIFNLAETKNYDFNTQCVDPETKIVTTGIVYGPNGCGKSNLGYAIFDIKNHLSDENKFDDRYRLDYLNAGSDSEIAEFRYIFQFGNTEVDYKYGKFSCDKIAYEVLSFNRKVVISFDRRIDEEAFIDLPEAKSLNRRITGDTVSVLKYVWNNTVVLPGSVDRFRLFYLRLWVDQMTQIRSIERHGLLRLHSQLLDIVDVIKDEGGDTISEFQDFLNSNGISCKLSIIQAISTKRVVFLFGNKSIDFLENASNGTLVLTDLFLLLKRIDGLVNQNLMTKEKEVEEIKAISFSKPFIYIDEFDAFYHHELSATVANLFKGKPVQTIFTTHNTSIMTNDLLRPDCYFVMNDKEIKPVYQLTDKDLRKAHSLEKIYRAGGFDA